MTRHAAALRPFKRAEFGPSPAAPTEGHIQAVNTLMKSLRTGLIDLTGRVTTAAREASAEPSSATAVRSDGAQGPRAQLGAGHREDLGLLLRAVRPAAIALMATGCSAATASRWTATRSPISAWAPRSPIPAPPPFCYMRTGFSPATFRRGIPLTRLGRQLNPFPLVQLPYHRLVNPWTLGAMLHEVSHNLQSDLGLSRDIPQRDRPPPARGRPAAAGGEDLDALEPRDVRRHVGAAARRPGNRRLADGRRRPRAARGVWLQPARAASDALFAHADQRRIAAADGLSDRCRTVSRERGRASIPIRRRATFRRRCSRPFRAPVRWRSTRCASSRIRRWGSKSLAQVLPLRPRSSR